MYALRWCDVNFSERLIEFSPGGRTGDPHRLPFDSPAELYGLMLRARAARRPDSDCPFVFHLDDGRRLQNSTMRYPWATAARAAGAERLVMYDLRRSGERNLLLSGVDVQTARIISGRRADLLLRAAGWESAICARRWLSWRAFLEARQMKTGKIVPIAAARRAR